jgi:hypothetical protein
LFSLFLLPLIVRLFVSVYSLLLPKKRALACLPISSTHDARGRSCLLHLPPLPHSSLLYVATTRGQPSLPVYIYRYKAFAHSKLLLYSLKLACKRPSHAHTRYRHKDTKKIKKRQFVSSFTYRHDFSEKRNTRSMYVSVALFRQRHKSVTTPCSLIPSLCVPTLPRHIPL